MKFVWHLLSNLSFFIIIGLVVAVIYFRAGLFPDHINSPVDRALTALEEKLDIEIPKYVATSKPFFAPDGEQQESIVYSAETDQPSLEHVYPESAIDTASVDEAEHSRDKSQDMMSVVEQIKVTVSDTVTDMLEAAGGSSDEAQQKTETVSASTVEPAPVSYQSVLHKARRAYWNGNMAEAEKAYQQLSELQSRDPNVFGELGNIYYAQGKWKQAGNAYYEAAIRLIELNQPVQVNYLLRVIQDLDVESANKLRQRMTG
jgi:hypothetical protein